MNFDFTKMKTFLNVFNEFCHAQYSYISKVTVLCMTEHL